VALDIITSGDHVPAARAEALGIVDAIVSTLGDAVGFARKLAATGLPSPVMAREEKVRGVDPAIFDAYRAKIAKKARGQIAPFKIIDCVEAACTKSGPDAIVFEQAAFQELLGGEQRKALVHYFFAEREARKIPGLSAEVKPLPIRRAAVIGAGTMGGGIAMVFANAGIPVKLLDVNPEALAKGRASSRRIMRHRSRAARSVRRGWTNACPASRAPPSTKRSAIPTWWSRRCSRTWTSRRQSMPGWTR
jgi:3-hydroxyacyl-CoA dehydrogenase